MKKATLLDKNWFCYSLILIAILCSLLFYYEILSAQSLKSSDSPIYDEVHTKGAKAASLFKSKEIAKLDYLIEGSYNFDSYQIDISSLKEKNGAIEVYAQAWQGTDQISFEDGTIDSERFLIYNPPILVEDSSGDIIKSYVDIDGKFHQKKFKEDPVEAIKQVLYHAILAEGFISSNIIEGKKGDTISIFYPTVEERMRADNKATYALAHDAATADASDLVDPTTVYNYKTGGTYYVRREGFTFDTSSLPDTDTISSLTFGLYGIAVANTDSDAVSVVDFNPASEANFVTADFAVANWGTTKYATDIPNSSWAIGSYNNFSGNATFISAINKTGNTVIGVRTAKDISNTAPTGATGVDFSIVSHAGSTQDPILTITHASAGGGGTPIPNYNAEIWPTALAVTWFWFMMSVLGTVATLIILLVFVNIFFKVISSIIKRQHGKH